MVRRAALVVLLALATAAGANRLTTFAWNAAPEWPAGTTIDLCANGYCESGITGTQHAIDVPVESGGVIHGLARARAGSLESSWATVAQTWPTDPVGVWAHHQSEGPIMAAYRDYAGATAVAESISCNVPATVVDNDLMLAQLIVRGNEITTVPSGWDLVTSAINFDGNGSHGYVYEKIAASESGSYTWGFPSSRVICAISAYPGVDTADPIDSYSNTAYVTPNTTIRSASVTTTAANQLVVNIALLSQTAQLTFTPPTDFTEQFEYGGNRCWSQLSTRTIASAGATDVLDVEMSDSSILKRGIAIVLNNASAAAAGLPRRALDGPFYGALRGSVR